MSSSLFDIANHVGNFSFTKVLADEDPDLRIQTAIATDFQMNNNNEETELSSA